MSNKQKTETKLSLDQNGVMHKTEVPKIEIEMPTELRTPRFKPEGRLMLLDPLPFENKDKDTFSMENIQMGANGQVEKAKIEIDLKTTESGLVIPDDVKEDRLPKGILVAKGNQVDEDYELGDIIVYKPIPNAALLFPIRGHNYLAVEQYMVFGKYEG